MTRMSHKSHTTSRTVPSRWAMVEIRPASGSPPRAAATGLIRIAGWNRTVITRRSCGRRTRYTAAGTVSFGTTLMPIATSDRSHEVRQSVRGAAEKRPDVMYQVRGIRGLLDDPPYDERDERPLQDITEFHGRLPGSADCSIMPVPLS